MHEEQDGGVKAGYQVHARGRVEQVAKVSTVAEWFQRSHHRLTGQARKAVTGGDRRAMKAYRTAV